MAHPNFSVEAARGNGGELAPVGSQEGFLVFSPFLQ